MHGAKRTGSGTFIPASHGRPRSPGPRLAAVAITCAVLALSGCTARSSSDTGPEEEVRAAVDTFLTLCARQDGVAALDLLTSPAEHHFLAADSVAAGCRELTSPLVGSSLSDASAVVVFREAKVTQVTVHGDLATAEIEGPLQSTAELEASDSGEAWHLSNPAAPR